MHIVLDVLVVAIAVFTIIGAVRRGLSVRFYRLSDSSFPWCLHIRLQSPSAR